MGTLGLLVFQLYHCPVMATLGTTFDFSMTYLFCKVLSAGFLAWKQNYSQFPLSPKWTKQICRSSPHLSDRLGASHFLSLSFPSHKKLFRAHPRSSLQSDVNLLCILGQLGKLFLSESVTDGATPSSALRLPAVLSFSLQIEASSHPVTWLSHLC